MYSWRLFVLLLLGFTALFADDQGTHNISFTGEPTPWFTGPLIAPSGYTVKPGHFSVQPFLNSFVTVATYDSHWKSTSVPNFYNVNIRVRIKAGITSWLDMQIAPQVLYKETQGQHSTNIGDLPIALNCQLLFAELNDPWPAIKLMLHTTIPIGKYEYLNANQLRTDAMGTGCWFPEAMVIISKMWHLTSLHFAEFRLATGYRIGTPVSVKGMNFYGGDRATNGTVYPGNILSVDGAFQYNFTQQWALACDLYYLHTNRTHFSGYTTLSNTHSSSEQFSLAPAIEYNWSKNLGIIGGVWFSFAGRNTSQFINGIISLSSYF